MQAFPTSSRVHPGCLTALLAVPFSILVLIALALLPFRTEPALPAAAPASADARRELARLVDGKDPRQIPEGETQTLTVSASQLHSLVAWAAETGVGAHTFVALRDGGLRISASVPLPRTRRWLELTAMADVALHDHHISLANTEARVGALVVPSWIVGMVAERLIARVEADPDAHAVLSAIQALELTQASASVTYSHVTALGGLAGRIAWGDGASKQIRESTEVQIAHLLDVLEKEPAGDGRMVRALREAFTLAMERSLERAPVEENRAALMALGAVLGIEQVLRALGVRSSPERIAQIHRVRDQTTLRNRNDWTRHFSVSGALTVLSTVAPSNAIGTLKEELDADGGSGFSFADLLADRCGTTLAERATESADSARTIQRKVAAITGVDAFFPRADGLPEGMQDAVFQRDYGGIGGVRYNELAAEIERRVASIPLYAR